MKQNRLLPLRAVSRFFGPSRLRAKQEELLSHAEHDAPPAYSRQQSNHPVAETKASRLRAVPVVDATTNSTCMLNLVRAMQAEPLEGDDSWLPDELYEACLLGKSREVEASEHAAIRLTCGQGDLQSSTFVAFVHDALCATQLPPRQLELAFDEVSLVNVLRRTPERLAVLKSWGVKLAVHDFGAHIAPFACLEDPSIESVVLSPSLVRQLTTSLKEPHYPLAVIRAVVEAATYLDLAVVASGINTFDQSRLLQSLGCVLQQGEFFRTGATPEHVAPRLKPLQSEYKVGHLQASVN